MCRYAQFTLSSRQLNYRGFPHVLLLIVIMAGKELYMVVSLSATGSSIFPKLLILWNLLAIYPSARSVRPDSDVNLSVYSFSACASFNRNNGR